MACRKAAYRAMTEMSEWMEAQQEQAEAKRAATEAEQRQVWTPTAVLEQCCTQWLAFGAEISSVGRASATRGCSGGCGKDHPRITLDFNSTTGEGQAVAVLSHALDPFVDYFEGLCQQGQATKLKDSITVTTRYHLTGFLQSHVDQLEQQKKFGSHLVKVSANALTASQRAQQKHAEALEVLQAAKKRKRQGPKDATKNLLEQVLHVLCHDSHQLADHLDLADLAWMQSANKLMAKYATPLLLQRLCGLELYYEVYQLDSIGVLVPVFMAAGHGTRENRDTGTLTITSSTTNGYQVLKTYKAITPQSSLSRRSCLLEYPATTNTTSATSDKKKKKKKKKALIPKEAQQFQMCPFPLPTATHGIDYNNHALLFVRVFVQVPSRTLTTNINIIPEADCFRQPLEVARYPVVGVQEGDFLHDGVFSASFLQNNKLTYKITTTTTAPATAVAVMASSENDSDSASAVAATAATASSNNNAASTSTSTLTTPTKKVFSIESIEFDFPDLLGIYVRKILPKAKAKYLNNSKRKRPATLREKNYVKALAKAAREAPGSKQDFERLAGW